jgi:hypothetical protein
MSDALAKLADARQRRHHAELLPPPKSALLERRPEPVLSVVQLSDDAVDTKKATPAS